ncbi:MAG: hypothetical protein R3243_11760 [Arenibacter latericius]|nr:hypothetical protein [Arenibacter latericius]
MTKNILINRNGLFEITYTRVFSLAANKSLNYETAQYPEITVVAANANLSSGSS